MTLTKLRMSRPAEARSTTASATSMTSRLWRRKRCLGLGDAHGCGLEGGAEIETSAADGGGKAEEQRGDEGEADGEGKHPSVDLN